MCVLRGRERCMYGKRLNVCTKRKRKVYVREMTEYVCVPESVHVHTQDPYRPVKLSYRK